MFDTLYEGRQGSNEIVYTLLLTTGLLKIQEQKLHETPK